MTGEAVRWSQSVNSGGRRTGRGPGRLAQVVITDAFAVVSWEQISMNNAKYYLLNYFLSSLGKPLKKKSDAKSDSQIQNEKNKLIF